MRTLWTSVAAAALIGAAPGWAASFTITTDAPTLDPATHAVRAIGHADRAGSYEVFANVDGRACAPTVDAERQGNNGPVVGGRTNVAPAEDFHDSYSFTTSGATSYRFCGYLGDYNENQSAPPDALGQLLVCAPGYSVQADACVRPPDSGSRSCAKSGRYGGINALNVDCAAAQGVARGWGKARGCRLGKKRSTCIVGGFRCKAKRHRPRGAGVRCAKGQQAVRFRFSG
jgi:hypothetical protein